MGVDESPAGTVPFTVTVSFEGEAPQGPLNMRRMTENLQHALGLAQREVRGKVIRGRRERMIESIMIRARQGDQNAMALIMGMREQAKRGNKRAQASLSLLRRIIRQRPAKRNVSFGFEEKPAVKLLPAPKSIVESAASIIVNGPTMKPGALYHVLANNYNLKKFRFALWHALEPELRPAFFRGYKRGDSLNVPTDLDEADAYRLGNTLACAKQLQDFRAHTGRISDYYPVAGWELGE